MREKNHGERLMHLLTEDKEPMTEATRLAAERDFLFVAGEYFETDGVELKTQPQKGGFEVTVRFLARRVKNFTSLK